MLYATSSPEDFVPSKWMASGHDVSVSLSVKSETKEVDASLSSLAKKSFPILKTAPLEEQLYSNKASLIILTSQLGMHLSDDLKRYFYNEIDELLDIQNFTNGDSLINVESFCGFLNFFIYYHNLKKPSLGVNIESFLTATWVGNEGCLTIEFLPGNYVRSILSKELLEVKEFDNSKSSPIINIYRGPLTWFEQAITAFDIDKWYKNAKI